MQVLILAHSKLIRSASTSKTLSAGLSISDILKRGNWSSQSAWQKFYNKDLAQDNDNFESVIFKGTL